MAQTRSWAMAQDRRARRYLESLRCYGAVRRRAEEVLRAVLLTGGEFDPRADACHAADRTG